MPFLRLQVTISDHSVFCLDSTLVLIVIFLQVRHALLLHFSTQALAPVNTQLAYWIIIELHCPQQFVYIGPIFSGNCQEGLRWLDCVQKIPEMTSAMHTGPESTHSRYSWQNVDCQNWQWMGRRDLEKPRVRRCGQKGLSGLGLNLFIIVFVFTCLRKFS
jgi:hypothetical protein